MPAAVADTYAAPGTTFGRVLCDGVATMPFREPAPAASIGIAIRDRPGSSSTSSG